jgi:peptidylprolyl isomerase
VDILGSLSPNAAASGQPVTAVPAGMPKVASQPGKKPTITSVAGVKEPATPQSSLLVKGDGEKIDPAKTLALQLIQTDIATGKQTQQTWGTGEQTVSASQVIALIKALDGQNVGSRAVVVTSAQTNSTTGAAQPGVILVVDVVGQY